MIQVYTLALIKDTLAVEYIFAQRLQIRLSELLSDHVGLLVILRIQWSLTIAYE